MEYGKKKEKERKAQGAMAGQNKQIFEIDGNGKAEINNEKSLWWSERQYLFNLRNNENMSDPTKEINQMSFKEATKLYPERKVSKNKVWYLFYN